jgi:hypothetical protein
VKGTGRRPSSADGLIATIEMAEGRRTREDRIPPGPMGTWIRAGFTYYSTNVDAGHASVCEDVAIW